MPTLMFQPKSTTCIYLHPVLRFVERTVELPVEPRRKGDDGNAAKNEE